MTVTSPQQSLIQKALHCPLFASLCFADVLDPALACIVTMIVNFCNSEGSEETC
jgi:hypothetical protein